MSYQPALDYAHIAKAIEYSTKQTKSQPTLAQIAGHLNLSQGHFDLLFAQWAGTTPQHFLRCITKAYIRRQLNSGPTLFDNDHLFSPVNQSRFSNLSITYEAITPAHFRQQAAEWHIVYGLHPTPFGYCVLGQTSRGECWLTFHNEPGMPDYALQGLQLAWPGATLLHQPDVTASTIHQVFNNDMTIPRKPIHLLLKGTSFQVRVWEALLQLPEGRLATYQDIARTIASPLAIRAVGTACGQNTIGYLIPCHRVLQKTGELGGYRWGLERKTAMLGWRLQGSPND